ncbi:MAG: branched-chain amino acid ABC transporter permease [Actinobacteria bacterium]|nr:branched-chain amino acid ABC transporter permease [Actinomycetota bacterium]
MTRLRHRTVLAPALVLAALTLPLLLPGYYLDVATRFLIFALFALSLDLLIGRTGLWSLGHATFFGCAAYGIGLFTTRIQTSFFLAVAVSLAATALAAALLGLLALRSRGLYFMLATLALAQVAWGLASRWRSVTGGDDGLPAIPRPDLWPLPWQVAGPVGSYVLTAAVVAVAGAALVAIVRSPFGRSLEGIREQETRMSSLGYHVWVHRYLAYVVSAVFAGVSGILFAYHTGIATPRDLSVTRSAEALLMVVLGGAGTLAGPILGAALVVSLQDLVGIYTDRWLTVFGLALVLTVVVGRKGLYRSWRGS